MLFDPVQLQDSTSGSEFHIPISMAEDPGCASAEGSDHDFLEPQQGPPLVPAAQGLPTGRPAKILRTEESRQPLRSFMDTAAVNDDWTFERPQVPRPVYSQVEPNAKTANKNNLHSDQPWSARRALGLLLIILLSSCTAQSQQDFHTFVQKYKVNMASWCSGTDAELSATQAFAHMFPQSAAFRTQLQCGTQ